MVLWFSYHDYRCCIRDPAREGSTPKAWERPATLASDTPRPLYGQKTPKKLVGFNVSFRTVHWTRIGHASVTVGVCFIPCGKKPECPEKRTTASLLGTDKPEQAALKLEWYTASSARLKLHRSLSVCVIEQHCSQQEPQMSHVLGKPPPTKKERKVRKLITFKESA